MRWVILHDRWLALDFRAHHPRRPATFARWRLLILEGVESLNLKLPEIPFVPRRNNQAVDSSCGRNHGILHQVERFAIQYSGPFPKALRIHGENLVGGGQSINPTLQFVSKLKDYICIEQVMIHSNSRMGRRRNLPLSGMFSSSNRGSGASNHSFRLSRAAF
jgi:hypothetical protein